MLTTHLVIVADESGSMHRIKKPAQDGINAILNGVRTEQGTAIICGFNHEVAWDYNPRPMRKAGRYRLNPNGGTALFDAIGVAIIDTLKWLAQRPIGAQPVQVIIVTVTDGQERDSAEWSEPAVAWWVRWALSQGWQFLVLGADSSTVAQAQSMGIPHESTMTFNADEEGTRQALGATRDAVVHTTRTGAPTRFN